MYEIYAEDLKDLLVFKTKQEKTFSFFSVRKRLQNGPGDLNSCMKFGRKTWCGKQQETNVVGEEHKYTRKQVVEV